MCDVRPDAVPRLVEPVRAVVVRVDFSAVLLCPACERLEVLLLDSFIVVILLGLTLRRPFRRRRSLAEAAGAFAARLTRRVGR